jgi:hypothetical protein
MIVLVLAVPVSAHPGTSSATTTVRKFYDWYLRGNWEDHFTQSEALLDPTLFTMMQSTLRWESTHPDKVLLDFDPFAATNAWGIESYTLGAPSVEGRDIRIPVTLTGTCCSPKRVYHKLYLTVVVRKSAGGNAVIYNFIYPDTNDNLRDTLRELLETR